MICLDIFLKCYLCPGNKRADGISNPDYDAIFVFSNDYSAVKEDQPDFHLADDNSSSMRLLF